MTIDYQHLFDTAKINPAKKAELKTICKRINDGMPRYKAVAKQLANGIPWWFIGITHFMEAGGKKDPFKYHLHCGDPLTGRTTHVPKNMPKPNPGNGIDPPSATNPYAWEFSALDALKYMKYDKQKKWDLPSCMLLFEKFNGMGYNKRGLYSPYLWSYTNYYVKGKFTGDGKFDPNAVSKQPGTAAILIALNP